MRKEYDMKFKEMIVQKNKSGEKVSKLVIDYDVKSGTIYKWISELSSKDKEVENIDYEKEYNKLLSEKNDLAKEKNEILGEMEALKKCIAIFSKK